VAEREGSTRFEATAGRPQTSARFADLLRHLRRSAGFSQQFLAERANISVEAIGALERGTRRAPHRETIALIGAALDLSDVQQAELRAAADASRARGERVLSVASETLNNLPASLTSFLGREEELAAIMTLLEQYRLVTITGFGGVGKTRTALEAAARFHHQSRSDVWFIDLSPIRDGRFIASELASTLRSILSAPIDSIEGFAAAIKSRRLLLVLDNCEHLIGDVVRVVHAILTNCPLAKILTTSRERLSTSGEALFRLPVLSLPERTFDDVDYVRNAFSAVGLFADRAEAIDHRFRFAPEHVDIVVDICRRLDGIPLAIELAAARLPALGLRALSRLLKERFVLGGGVRDFASRQQSMYSTIDWSYQLLGESERVLLRRLAVFPGTMSLDAVAGTCNDKLLCAAEVPEVLSSLVDKSLVATVNSSEQMRYALLDSVRSYSLERLENAGERKSFLGRHAEWFADVADRATLLPVLTILNEQWPEVDNVRSALDWSIYSADDDMALLGARIIYGFRALWMYRGQHSECRAWAQAALERIDERRSPLAAARLEYVVEIYSDGGADALAAGERALLLFKAAGDRQELAHIYCRLVFDYTRRLRLDDAENAAQQAQTLLVELRLQTSVLFCWLLVNRAVLYAYTGRFEEARRDVETAEGIASRDGDELFVISRCWSAWAEIELAADRPDLAAKFAEKMLSAEIEPPTGGLIAMNGLSLLAKACLLRGQLSSAKEAATEMLENVRFGLPQFSMDAISVLATVGADSGSAAVAACLLGYGDEWRRKSDQPPSRTDAQIRLMLVAALNRRLRSDELERAREDGSNLTLLEATELALTLN
jgi:predicted ATPase/DNA-binding XRE family transcriptional regulator